MRFLALFSLFCFASLASAATPKTEIEGLLAYLKGLEGAVFIRNGSEHSASEAEAHLRLKWERQADKIATAEDFIALCATRSSMSGERYRIRFQDGTTRFSGEVFTEQLHRQRGDHAAPAR